MNEDAPENFTLPLPASIVQPGQLFVLPYWTSPPGYWMVEWIKVEDRSLGFVLISLN